MKYEKVKERYVMVFVVPRGSLGQSVEMFKTCDFVMHSFDFPVTSCRPSYCSNLSIPWKTFITTLFYL